MNLIGKMTSSVYSDLTQKGEDGEVLGLIDFRARIVQRHVKFEQRSGEHQGNVSNRWEELQLVW